MPQNRVKKYTVAIEWAKNEVKEIDKDERFHYKPANVMINAPLALIQVDLSARYRTLKHMLKLLGESK